MNCHLMDTQNLVISFDYSWFLAKNLAYAEWLILKFHYQNYLTFSEKKKNFLDWIMTGHDKAST